MDRWELHPTIIAILIIVTILLFGYTFGFKSQCQEKFSDPSDISYCVDMLSSGKKKLYQIESKGWKVNE